MRIRDLDDLPTTEDVRLIECAFSKDQLRECANNMRFQFAFDVFRTKRRAVKALLHYGAREYLYAVLAGIRLGSRVVLQPYHVSVNIPILRVSRDPPNSRANTVLPPSGRRTPEHGRRRIISLLQNVRNPVPNHSGSNLTDLERFLEIPDTERMKELYQAFYDATSDSQVQLLVCAVCSRERMRCEWDIAAYHLRDIPHKEKLQPYHPHPAQTLIHGLLLSPAGLVSSPGEEDIVVRICSRCINELSSSDLDPPKYSLANNLWTGDEPWPLKALTFLERLLVCRVYPRAYTFKLWPKTGTRHDPETLRWALQGNVTSFDLDITKISHMVEGMLMPHRPAILASLISVTYVGPGKLPKSWLKRAFKVRRDYVRDALRWLKVGNPTYYGDVVVDEGRLEALPEDDVPYEVFALVRQERNEAHANAESAGYGHGDTTPLDMSGDTGPDVIPMHALGTIDTDLTKLTTAELKRHGVINLWKDGKEGLYRVQHGSRPVSDFPFTLEGERVEKDYWVSAFPTLFPYAIGGINAERPVPLSLAEHVKWLLEQHDHRFRINETFSFVACAALQRRQALASARLQMRTTAFQQHAHRLSRITLDQMNLAAAHEERGGTISDELVLLLRREVFATAGRVFGTDSTRFKWRSSIWSTIVAFGPPSLWITINPDDMHDPLLQVMVGEKISMDKFDELLGPDMHVRAQNAARDGCATAKFFHYVVDTVFRTLFGITVTENQIKAELGIFGRVRAYFGVEEVQGRGMLHLHLLMWLEGAPSASEMDELLRLSQFRDRVLTYIRANFRAFHPRLSSVDTFHKLKSRADVAYCRPPNPAAATFDDDADRLEVTVARTKQYHACNAACLKIERSGKIVCKRHAPWPLSVDDKVESDGTWMPKRGYGYLATYVPALSVNLRCNNDGKLLLNAGKSMGLTFYITAYAAKKQSRSYNLSAVLARAFAYHQQHNPYLENLMESQRLLLFRSTNEMNKLQELAMPLVSSYLLGYPETKTSHRYIALYWTSFHIALVVAFPELSDNADPQGTSSQASESNPTVADTSVVSLTLTEGRAISASSNVLDYAYRGEELSAFSLYDFVKETYEGPARGSSAAIPYSDLHPNHKSRVRFVRKRSDRCIPDIKGRYLPRSNDTSVHDLYCASILTLFNPWTNLTRLKEPTSTWDAALTSFRASASPYVNRMIDNIQYRYDSEDAANAERDQRTSGQLPDRELAAAEAYGAEGLTDVRAREDNMDPLALAREPDAEAQVPEMFRPAEAAYGEGAVDIGRAVGIFDDYVRAPLHPTARVASANDFRQLQGWRAEMQAYLHDEQLSHARPDVDEGVNADVGLLTQDDTDSGPLVEPISQDVEDALQAVNPSFLKRDQRRAYDIITSHLDATLEGRRIPQLFMQALGEAGTGKSMFIQTLTQHFETRGVPYLLLKSAYTGIAASLIDGKTCSGVACMYIRTANMPDRTRERLSQTWSNIEYLVIDEVSMISRAFMARMERHISIGRGNGLPWGGINVLLCGDFHQFPPVAGKKRAPLYYEANQLQGDTEDDCHGRILYEQFRTVVLFKEQVRATDPVWAEFLSRARNGAINDDDAQMLNGLTLRNPRCPPTDWSTAPWKDAILVTPRHSSRIRWNEASVQKHAAERGVQIFYSPAQDTIRQRPLTALEALAAAQKDKRAEDNSRTRQRPGERGGLPNMVPVFVGMKVMVTLNIETDLDLTNGTRGEVTDIMLDPEERASTRTSSAREVYLDRPPVCILVRVHRTRMSTLTGLGERVLPVEPVSKTYGIKVPESDGTHVGRTVRRRQLPITPAYAFTDYRSQGQTISNVILDLRAPPSGKLTMFSMYVPCSRPHGREDVRVLVPFEKKVLSESIPAALKREDERLEHLNAETEKWWRKQLDSVGGW